MLPDRMCAKGNVARRLGHFQADLRLEPLPVLIQERDQRDRHVADFGRESGEIVQGRLRRRVEHVVLPQGLQAADFAGHGSRRINPAMPLSKS
jgi:hypothetical protein